MTNERAGSFFIILGFLYPNAEKVVCNFFTIHIEVDAMDKDKMMVALFLAVLLASIVGAAYLFSISASLEQKLEALNRTSTQQLSQAQESYFQLNSRYNDAQARLRETTSSLAQANSNLASVQTQLAQTEAELNKSKENLAGQQQKVNELNSEFSQLESSINSSMSWFRDNAFAPGDFSFIADPNQQRVMAGFIPRLETDCVDKNSLNLACISHLMENSAFSIHYRSDIASGSDDHLQGVKETIGLGWGDCEDYSLIFKAILNSIRKDSAGLNIVAWQPAESGEYRVYPKETPGETGAFWVYSNAKGANMGSPSHAYVICYSVDEASGHCTVALSDADVQESSQVPQLEGSYAFEPQNGRYLGKLGESLSICASSGCRNMGGKIWLVIADSDLYVYGENGWQGYADYLSRVQQAKAGIADG